MRICAEFIEEDAALEGHQALLDQGIHPESIDVRSAYPLPESALPPHRSHPMLIRNWVRLLWVTGATLGFSFLVFTQKVWPLHTAGHPIVSLPINFIITYECGMITGLITTMVFLFLETRRYRNLNPPAAEDLPVERGNIAIIVEGSLAEKAAKILEAKGAKAVVKLSLLLLLISPFLSGCSVKMRDQDWIKSTEASQTPTPQGAIGMPTVDETKKPIVKSLGYSYPLQMRLLDKKTVKVPPAFKGLVNPVARDQNSISRGELVFEHNCLFCHGASGHGDGPVGQVFLPTPANLTSDKVKHETDGELFYKITVGPSTMPSFANRLSTQERFDVINYIRSLQKK